MPVEAAVSMPMTCPAGLTSGPPESPGWMLAFVSSMPLSCSDELPSSSLAVIDWFRAVIVPAATDGVPPLPPALPSATTCSPEVTCDELPGDTVASPDAPCSCSTAMSSVLSYPTTFAV